MKLSIIGHARHGKDTVAELLRDGWGLKFESSSRWCAERIMMPAFNGLYDSVDTCYNDRINHREFWHKKIAEFCESDLTALGQGIWRDYDIYVGTRSDREFFACKNAGLFDFSVWVDRSLHLPPEPYSSMKLEKWMADYVLDNNGTLDQLQANLNRLMTTLKRKHAFNR